MIIFIEIILTFSIFVIAAFIIYRNISKKISGKCTCDSFPEGCPNSKACCELKNKTK